MNQPTTPCSYRSPRLYLCLGLLLGIGAGLALRPGTGHADGPPALIGPARGERPVPTLKQAGARALSFAVTIESDGIYGAGVLVLPARGLVLTADHVVADMKHPRVSFVDGASMPARVLDRDRWLDLALLEIPPQTRPAPELGDALSLEPGDEVLAVGCPRHLPFSVSRGVVSFVGRAMDGARWIQTDIPINDGNSGGPVVDREGRLVGLTSFILRRAQGLSFALPPGYAIERFPQLAALVGPAELERFRRWRGPLPGSAP